MAIGSIDTASPASNASAGQGDDEIRALKTDITQSLPAWVPGDDVLAASAPELDTAVSQAGSAVQTFNGRSGNAITPADDDYTIANIDDAAAGSPVARADRNFLSTVDKAKLDGIETGATNTVNIDDLDDVNVTGAVEGDILQLNGFGTWVDARPGAIMPKVEMYRCREAATPSGPNKYQPYFTTVDENTVSTLGTVANSSTDGWKFTAAAGKTVEVSISANLGFGSGTLILALVSGGDRTVSIANFNAASITPRVYAYQQNSSAVGHLSSTFLLTDGEEVMLHSNSTTHQATAGARSSRIVMMLREVLTA